MSEALVKAEIGWDAADPHNVGWSYYVEYERVRAYDGAVTTITESGGLDGVGPDPLDALRDLVEAHDGAWEYGDVESTPDDTYTWVAH